MPLYDYKCDKCEFMDEYNTSISVPKEMNPPEKCPKCQEGNMVQQFSVNQLGIDFIGPGFYINDYGKHAWKKNNSLNDQAKILAGEKDPY